MDNIHQIKAQIALKKANETINNIDLNDVTYRSRKQQIKEFIGLVRSATEKVDANNSDIDINPYNQMGYIIIDSWPKNTELGNALLNVEDKLERYVKYS